jgi:hypothetical protein
MRKITQKILIILIGLSPMFTLQGQNLNDICLGATELTNLDNWCSSVGAYNNNLATPSLDEIDVLCWPEIGNDIFEC